MSDVMHNGETRAMQGMADFLGFSEEEDDRGNPWLEVWEEEMRKREEEIRAREEAEKASEVSDEEIGAKVLAQVNFQKGRNEEIVESSFDKMRSRGERLMDGTAAERRNYAYIKRLEEGIERHGNEYEQRLWRAATKKLIVEAEDIPEKYWEQQEQILRDDGQGRKLGWREKERIVDNLQKQQEESLGAWAEYLGDVNSPFPVWFKVYAWDGVSKMGAFDKERGEFSKRDKTTVAPYPKLNPAVLGLMYGAIAGHYGVVSGADKASEEPEFQEKIDGLIRAGGFPKLYAKILLNQKMVLATPEKTEDVTGAWIEYSPGEEEKLAAAAEGTPWCVAHKHVGARYLGSPEEDDREYEEVLFGVPTMGGGDLRQNHARFLLFHLQDPETKKLSESAAASIRLNREGFVAEISGLKEGQALEDALVPIVEEKVKNLPGGEAFLQAFLDKKELIRLDRKMQAGGKFSDEEGRFIWETERRIWKLDTYNKVDPRLVEMRKRYDLSEALRLKASAHALAQAFEASEIAANFDAVAESGADLMELAMGLGEHYTNILAERMIEKGLDAIWLMETPPHPLFAAEHFEVLIKHAPVEAVLEHLGSYYTIFYLDRLMENGAPIEKVIEQLNSKDAWANFERLAGFGAKASEIAAAMSYDDIVKNAGFLIVRGVDVEGLKKEKGR